MEKKQLKQIAKKHKLSQSGTKELLVTRLCESAIITEIIKDPFRNLLWYERLFLLSLIDGTKRKSKILDSDLFKIFIGEIIGKKERRNYTLNRVFRSCKKDLVKRKLVYYNEKTRSYSLVPDVKKELPLISETIIKCILGDFKKSFFYKYYYSPKTAFRTKILKKSKLVKYSKKLPLNVDCSKEVERIRILAFSDWRVQNIQDIISFAKKISPIDFILYAGDDVGRFRDLSGLNYFEELATLCSANKVLAIIGNDDNYSSAKEILNSKNVLDLYSRSITYGNFAFIGLESSTSGPAIFRHTEEDFQNQLEHQYNKLIGKKIVILSHTPPYGVLDRGLRFASLDDNTQHHIGSTALREFIDNNSVDLVICGHCHSHGGLSDICMSTKIVNVSSHDNVGSLGRFAVIELDSNGEFEVSWHDTREVLGENSIQRILGVGHSYSKKLEKCGITTIEELANCNDINDFGNRSGVYSKLFSTFQLRAKAMLENKNFQIRPFDVPDEKVIFVDIETDLKCEKVWLIGLLVDGEFIQLFADTWAEEKSILKKYLEILKKYPKHLLVSYSGTNFDYRIPLEALKRHKMETSPLLSHKHLDLYHEVRNCFIFPISSYALKEIGAYLEYEFKFSELNGMMVAIKYLQHLESGKPLDEKFLKYNEDDVRVIQYIISSLKSPSTRFCKI